MPIDIDILAKIISPALVAVIGALAKRYLEAKPKLISYLVHASAHPLPSASPTPKQPDIAHTHVVVVRNACKKAAHNVRIGHMFLPQSYQIHPPVSHTISHGQGDSAEIVIPVLVPGEQITISYLYFPPILWNQIGAYTKSDEGMAKEITVIPSIQYSKPFVAVLWALLFVGATTCTYWAFIALSYLL